MTPAQQASFRRIAVLCAAKRNWGPLYSAIDLYANRARSSLDHPSVDAAAGHRRATGPTAADAWKPLGWWKRLMRIG